MLGQNLLDLFPSLSGKVFTCWDRTPLIDMLCWIKTAPRPCCALQLSVYYNATLLLLLSFAVSPALPPLELSSQPVALKFDSGCSWLEALKFRMEGLRCVAGVLRT